ncbi:MAG: sensor histidine kinase [Prochlorotrichaceae cyanobacterium]
MPFSPELTALCQAQLNVLMQFDGSAQGIVYLSETGEDLCPVAVYPSIPAVNLLNHQFVLAAEQEQEREDVPKALEVLPLPRTSATGNLALPAALPTAEQELLYQVVLPLQEDRYVLGALVVSRGDRDWQAGEYQWLEQVAQTLTWAGLMDRRLQWLQQQLQEKQAEADRQEDALETLLHQIRNPLTALKTFGKLLLRRLSLQDQNRSVAESIVRESDRLQFLLQELKNQFHPVSVLPSTDVRDSSGSPLVLPGRVLSSIRPTLPPPMPGTLNDDLREINLESVLAWLIPGVQAIAEERNLHFAYTGLTIAVPIQAAVNPLRETLSNLIDNAMKYTPSGGSVQVQWLRPGGEHSGWQWVVVSDNGPGIPAEDLPHLFERHYRGVQAHGDIPGTGIGLAVAYEWMVQMGGQLEVISPAGMWRPEGDGGRGVAFRVWLKETADA